MVDRIKLKIPIFGIIISKSSISRFCRTLGTLINSGVPILEALHITRETSDNAFFEKVLVNAPDLAVRANRLALLGRLNAQVSSIAELSEIVTSSTSE